MISLPSFQLYSDPARFPLERAGTAPEEPVRSRNALSRQDDRFSATAAAFQYRFAEQSKNFRLSIQTTDGDLVTIEIHSADYLEKSALARGDARVISTAWRSETRLSYTVTGDLNSNERQAIDQLLAKIDRVTDRFFANDISTALKRMGNLGFDPTQITSFALSLEYQGRFQAVTAYRETGGLRRPAEVGRVADFVRELQALPFEKLDFLQEPASDTADLMAGVGRVKAARLDRPVEVAVLAQLKQLVQLAFERYTSMGG